MANSFTKLNSYSIILALLMGCIRSDSQSSTIPRDPDMDSPVTSSQAAKKSGDEWPFDDPKNLAVITLDRIIDGSQPILYVCHDEDDGGWQFLDGDDVQEKNAQVVGLGEIVKLDPTIADLADLKPGWGGRT